jgi:hypothetical protein
MRKEEAVVDLKTPSLHSPEGTERLFGKPPVRIVDAPPVI